MRLKHRKSEILTNDMHQTWWTEPVLAAWGICLLSSRPLSSSQRQCFGSVLLVAPGLYSRSRDHHGALVWLSASLRGQKPTKQFHLENWFVSNSSSSCRKSAEIKTVVVEQLGPNRWWTGEGFLAAPTQGFRFLIFFLFFSENHFVSWNRTCEI